MSDSIENFVPAQRFRLEICALRNKAVHIDVNIAAPVFDVQARIEERLGIAPCHQLLSLRDVDVQLGIVNRASGKRLIRLQPCSHQNVDCWHDFDNLPRTLVLNLTDFTSLVPSRIKEQDFTYLPIETVSQDVCWIPKTEHRGCMLSQFERLVLFLKKHSDASGKFDIWYNDFQEFEALELAKLNLYDAASWIILPATSYHRCSFVELLASDPEEQMPDWFVTHWWGEPIMDFVACLKGHCKNRALNLEVTAYWVCAYANNQHQLGAEIAVSPADTSFFRAMQASAGVLLILDGNATPFRRSWCIYEQATVLTPEVWHREWGKDEFLFDIAASSNNVVYVLTDRLTESERSDEVYASGVGWYQKSAREKNFPVNLISRALGIEIEGAQASVELDRRRILNSIAKRPESELDCDPLISHAEYLRVNRALHAIFAVSAWPSAVDSGAMSLLVGFADALRADELREELCLSFAGSKNFNDDVCEQFASSFPRNMQKVVLILAGCTSLGDDGLRALGLALPKSIRELHLDLAECNLISDQGLKMFMTGLSWSLENLKLNLKHCSAITDASLASLGDHLSLGLRSVELNFEECTQLGDPGLVYLASRFPAALSELCLTVRKCTHVSDASLLALSRNLPFTLKDLRLDISFCKAVCGPGLIGLVKALPADLEYFDFEAVESSLPAQQRRHCESLEKIRCWQQILLAQDQACNLETLNAVAMFFSSRHACTRMAAALFFGQVGSASPEICCELANLTLDKDHDVRKAAAESLGLLDSLSTPHLASLEALLEDRHWEVPPIAAQALSRLRAASCLQASKLVKRLGDRSEVVRECAAVALRFIGIFDISHSRALVEKLADKSASVRCAAGRALQCLSKVEHCQALASALQHGELDVRTSAVEALGVFGTDAHAHAGAVAQLLRSRDSRIWPAAAKTLVQLEAVDADVVEEFAQWFGSIPACRCCGSTIHSQALALDAMTNFGVAAAPHASYCALGIESKMGTVRLSAIRALGVVGAAAIPHADALTKSLADPDEEIRRAAEKILVGLGDSYLAALVTALENGCEKIRQVALQKLSALGDRTSAYANVIAGLLQGLEVKLWPGAAEVLCNSGSEEVLIESVKPIMLSLTHHDAQTRVAACKALGWFGKAGIPCTIGLADCLHDDSSSVRIAAIESLEKLGAKELAGVIESIAKSLRDRFKPVVVGSAGILERLGHVAVPYITAALAAEQIPTREAAAEVFLAWPRELTDEHIALLAYAVEHSNRDVQAHIQERLRTLGDEQQVSAFAQAMKHVEVNVRHSAVAAFLQLPSSIVSESRSLCAFALDHTNEDIREAGWKVLQHLDTASLAEVLTASLWHMDRGLREAAAARVLQMQADLQLQHRSALAAILDHRDRKLQLSIKQEVWRLGTESHARALTQALHHPDPAVHEAVLKHIGKLDSDMMSQLARMQPFEEAIASCLAFRKLTRSLVDIRVRILAAEVIGTVAVADQQNCIFLTTLAPHLATCLADQCHWVREAAARSLGMLGSSAAAPHVIALADVLHPQMNEAEDERDDEAFWLAQSAAAKVLGLLGPAIAGPYAKRLQACINDVRGGGESGDEFRAVATGVLGLLQGKPADDFCLAVMD